jgi:DNA-binding CsgD family transcriptional regulator
MGGDAMSVRRLIPLEVDVVLLLVGGVRSSRTLAEELGISVRYARQLLARLEAAGYVERATWHGPWRMLEHKLPSIA